MSSVPPIQDMPPQGGYSKINYKRVPAKTLLPAVAVGAALIATHLVALYLKLEVSYPLMKREKIEMRSARLATYPFIEAQNDRAALIQLNRNRKAEEELMKDVEGWEVGTLMGEPIYKTIPKEEWVAPHRYEYWAHAKREDFEQHHYVYRRR